MQGRGAEALTNEGDPLINYGVNARKVPIEFAKGYTKGVSDQVKRTYWAQQSAQKTAAKIFKAGSATTTPRFRNVKIQAE